MAMRIVPSILMTIACAAGPGAVAAGSPRQGPEPCTLQAGPSFTVVRVEDAETLTLDDGTELRLVGALAPSPPRYLASDAVWPPHAAARATLERLVLGRRIELAYSGRRSDRWGRHLAHAFVVHRGQREWVQGAMLREGHARASVLPGATECLDEMLAHERLARTAEAGLWANSAYAVRMADDPRLLRLRNNFELIEGRVREVSRTRSRIYLNFGADWRIDFTVGASRRAPDLLSGAEDRLMALAGKTIRVRGWIERRNGPYIELLHESQIETVDEDPLPPSPGIARHGEDNGIDKPARAPTEEERRPKQAPDALDL